MDLAYKRLDVGTKEVALLLKKKLDSQNYCCAYTNEPLVFGENVQLDHILPVSRFPEIRNDPNNVEWVSARVNHAKNAMTRDEFIEFCRIISQRVV
jgi:5-methylcytosine-specific restriction endonuclease McrA